MRWVKDPKVEAAMRRLGIAFEVQCNIKLSDIDWEEGLRRQVRLDRRLNDDNAIRYGLAMAEEGAAFPMPILQREKKRLWPWSGNHRGAGASLAGVETVDAYTVEIFDPVMMDLFPRLVNTWEAVVGMSKEEAVINARHMIDKHGFSPAEAAKLFNVKESSIYVAGQAARVKEVLAEVGVPSTGLTTTALKQLHSIENKNALREATSLIHAYGIKGKDVESLCSDVAKQSTEALMLVEVKKWRDVMESRAKAKRGKAKAKKSDPKPVSNFANRDRLMRHLTGLSRFLESVTTASQAQILDPEHAALVVRYWSICERGMRKMLTEGGGR